MFTNFSKFTSQVDRVWIAEWAVNAASLYFRWFGWCLTCFATNTAHSIHPFVYQNNKNIIIIIIIVFILHFLKSVMQEHVHLRAVSLDSS